MGNYSISINERVEAIKNNVDEIDRLIQEYKPFIASIVEGSAGRYVRYGEDDELSIGLMGFEEAVKSYNSSKGNFLVFAKNVIKRRLIDYYRKESKHNNAVPLIDGGGSQDNEDEEFDLTGTEAVKLYSQKEEAEERKAEIEELKAELQGWGISFFDVARSSPKQEGTRKIYFKIVDFLVANKELLDILKKKKYLPIADIEKNLKIPRKKIERARNYIVAAVLIKSGDYQYLKSFIEWR